MFFENAELREKITVKNRLFFYKNQLIATRKILVSLNEAPCPNGKSEN